LLSSGGFVQVIESALAFAVVMLVLSMLTTTMVEMIHRALGLREQGLKYMLGQLFDQVLAGAVKRSGGFAKIGLETLRKDFVDRMTSNRAPMGMKPDGQATPTSRVDAVLGRVWNGDRLGILSVQAFMERLGSDHIGDQLVSAARADAVTAVDVVLQDVAQKFDAFGREASTFFERRARFMSVLVAIGVAFALHVDAIDIFQTFMRDPVVRARVIAQTDEITRAYDESRQAPAAPPAVAPAAPAAPNQLSGADDFEEVKKKYEKAIEEFDSARIKLRDLGVPIGWNEERQQAAYLWFSVKCEKQPVSAGRGTAPAAAIPQQAAQQQALQRAGCKPDERLVEGHWNVFPALRLYLSLLLGGLLIGLGAPFWYDAVKSLTSIRSLTQRAQAATPDGAAGVAGPAQTPTAQPQTPVDIFKAANTSRPITVAAASAAPMRPHLNPDGTIADQPI
jgi:hypothetical protein